jgi:FkbM family methyltransferase
VLRDIRQRLKLPITDIATSGDLQFKYRTDIRDGLYLKAFRPDFGQWEQVSRHLFAEVSRSARVVVDVGAYSGIYSLIALSASDTSQVHAFEPLTNNFNRTKRNLKLNPIFDGRWQLHKCALGSNSRLDIIHFEPRGTNDTASLKKDYRANLTAQEQVRVTTLDDLNLEDIDLIKIDAEQHDHHVIHGAASLIRSSQPVIFFEAQEHESLHSSRSHLAACGYWGTALIDERKHIHVAISKSKSSKMIAGHQMIEQYCVAAAKPVFALS